LKHFRHALDQARRIDRLGLSSWGGEASMRLVSAAPRSARDRPVDETLAGGIAGQLLAQQVEIARMAISRLLNRCASPRSAARGLELLHSCTAHAVALGRALSTALELALARAISAVRSATRRSGSHELLELPRLAIKLGETRTLARSTSGTTGTGT